MAKQAVARTVDLEPIDRLEEKLRLLIDTVTQLRGEQAKAIDENTRLLDENARLSREVDTLRSRVADAEATGAELATLRDERDLIRTRVADMLSQLDAL
jgi:regulator of replication initiation timing